MIRSWLTAQGAAYCIVRSSTSASYERYDARLSRYIVQADSPGIQRDSSVIILDKHRRRLAEIQTGTQPVSVFYVRGKELRSGTPILCVQRIAGHTENKTVCDPLALSGSSAYKTVSGNSGTDSVIRFYQADGAPQQRYNGERPARFQFEAGIPADLPFSVRSLVLKDRRGLVKYLWQGSDAYKISYQ